MQPAKLGAATWCFVWSALIGMLVLVPQSRAQTVFETPQQTNERIRTMSVASRAVQHDYIIGRGDLVLVEVFDVPELSRELRVSQTGTIGIPLVPVRLHMAGLSEIQCEQKIAEVLEANGLVSHPQVSCSVKEKKSKPITIVGAVQHPMVYEADRPVTVVELLAEAGGIAADAGDTVIVTRQESADDNASVGSGVGSQDPVAKTPSAPAATQNSAEPPPVTDPAKDSSAQPLPPEPEPSVEPNRITINLNQLVETGDAKDNILLRAGDIVTVPHAGIVYALGAVARPGGFVVANERSQMSTLKLLSLAGGMARTAKSDKAVIIRKDTSGKQQQVVVDLKRIMKQESEDVQLRPSDVLYVPENNTKAALLKAAEIGVAVGTAVAIFRLAYR